MRQRIGGKDGLGGVHVERSTIQKLRWSRMWSSLQDGQGGRGLEFNEDTQAGVVEVEVRSCARIFEQPMDLIMKIARRAVRGL